VEGPGPHGGKVGEEQDKENELSRLLPVISGQEKTASALRQECDVPPTADGRLKGRKGGPREQRGIKSESNLSQKNRGGREKNPEIKKNKGSEGLLKTKCRRTKVTPEGGNGLRVADRSEKVKMFLVHREGTPGSGGKTCRKERCSLTSPSRSVGQAESSLHLSLVSKVPELTKRSCPLVSLEKRGSGQKQKPQGGGY